MVAVTFENIITLFPDPKNVILDTKWCFFVFIVSQAVMYSCDISTNFGGHFVFEFGVGKIQNRGWHGADLESAYPNCVRATACQILLKNALPSEKFQKWALTIKQIIEV